MAQMPGILIMQYWMAISDTNAFCLNNEIRISSANRNRMMVGKIMNRVFTSRAMFRYWPHYRRMVIW